MSKLEKTLVAVGRLQDGDCSICERYDARSLLITTVAYMVLMLSVPAVDVGTLLLMGIYPVVAAALNSQNYGRFFLRSLWVLPLVVLIGFANPLEDKEVAFHVGTAGVSGGWISFAGIILRGLLSMQALLILLHSAGFRGVVGAMRSLGMPVWMTTQLLMVMRYISVLMEEALSMQRAREARGFGRRSLPLKMWGVMIGQLFIRSVERSERIARAMSARGFSGTMPEYKKRERRLTSGDILYPAVWTALFCLIRFTHVAAWLGHHMAV